MQNKKRRSKAGLFEKSWKNNAKRLFRHAWFLTAGAEATVFSVKYLQTIYKVPPLCYNQAYNDVVCHTRRNLHYNIMQIMLLLLRGMAFLYYQMQVLHAVAVFRAGGYNIYTRGVYAAVTQNIGKLCKVFFDLIKQPGKQMPQIMGKHLFRADICPRTQRFHLPPDICSVKRLPQTRYKYHTRFYPLLRSISEQFSF